MADNEQIITLYTSNICPQAWAVERFMNQYEAPIQLINIDSVEGARQELIEMNNGYASVPTLIFPDGEKMVEPTFAQLKEKLGIEEKSVLARILGVLRL